MKTTSTFSKTAVHSLFVLASTFALALTCSSSALAGTLLVDDDSAECPDAGFTSIQGAVDAAAPGDVIQVCPGTYDEQVGIGKPLSLVGIKRDGKNAAVVQPSNMVANTKVLSENFFGAPVRAAAAILVRDTSDVIIKNIVVDGTDNGMQKCGLPILFGIYYRNASGLIESATVRNIKLGPGLEVCPNGLGIYTDSDSNGSSELTVMNSSVHDCQLNGIAGMESATNLRVIGNAVTGLGSEAGFAHPGIAIGWDARGSIEDNSVINYSLPSCNSISDCDFSSTGILVFFTTAEISIARNVVGKTNAGIFVNSSSGVSVLENHVSDTDVFDGVAVIGDNNTVKNNTISNSDESGVFLQGANNAIQDNTINDATIGLLVTAGNSFSGNRLFNTPVTKEVFVPEVSPANDPGARRRAAIAPFLKLQR